jgi:hypothetical protein
MMKCSLRGSNTLRAAAQKPTATLPSRNLNSSSKQMMIQLVMSQGGYTLQTPLRKIATPMAASKTFADLLDGAVPLNGSLKS